jgi:PAC2 family protein
VRDPSYLYELKPDLPTLDRPVLIQALTSFVDAGGAVRQAREHLLSALSGEVIAAFDIDELFDYRSRRPIMDFVEDHWESYDNPDLQLHLLNDREGTPFLMLAGPEPDLRWEQFIRGVIQLIERLGVRVTVGLNAIPLAVPHTRPSAVTAHATKRELIPGYEPWLQHVRVPASAGHLLEFRLGQAGFDAMGFAAHVPHYLAQTDYPAAAERLLTAVSKATGLLLPTEELRTAAESTRTEIDQQIARADEAAAVVRSLEQQYDAFVRGRESTLLAGDPPGLPTADELGAELERFLAEQARPGDPPATDL